MDIQLILAVILVLISLSAAQNADDGWVSNIKDALSTSGTVIAKNGYQVELHSIASPDQYIQQLYRIPCKQNEFCDRNEGKLPVLLLPGFYLSAYSYVIQPNMSLGYGLAEKGYDVWIANLRGQSWEENTYISPTLGKNHWRFSMDTMAHTDLPVLIDHILNITKQESLTAVGHSLGSTVLFALLSESPEYNQKINLAFMMAPGIYVAKHTGPFRLLTYIPFGPFLFTVWQGLFGFQKAQPSGAIFRIFGNIICNGFKVQNKFCRMLAFITSGYDPRGIPSSIIPSVINHISSASALTSLQMLQQTKQGRFARFDYGPLLNLKKYKRLRSPRYKLAKITTPVILMNGKNDKFTNRENDEYLKKHVKSLVYNYDVPDEDFSHLSFTYSKKIVPLVNDFIYEQIEQRVG